MVQYSGQMLTSDFLFKQTLNNFFEIDDFQENETNSFYIKEYNLCIIQRRKFFSWFFIR